LISKNDCTYFWKYLSRIPVAYGRKTNSFGFRLSDDARMRNSLYRSEDHKQNICWNVIATGSVVSDSCDYNAHHTIKFYLSCIIKQYSRTWPRVPAIYHTFSFFTNYMLSVCFFFTEIEVYSSSSILTIIINIRSHNLTGITRKKWCGKISNIKIAK